MKLRLPSDRLAGRVWLPRCVDKARACLEGSLPLSYRVAFGSRLGVDGYFLRHFQLSRRKLLWAVRDSSNEQTLAEWFLKTPAASPSRIETWNELAPRLGSRGHPGYATLKILKWVFYPKSIRLPVRGIFEAIEQDEGPG